MRQRFVRNFINLRVKEEFRERIFKMDNFGGERIFKLDDYGGEIYRESGKLREESEC